MDPNLRHNIRLNLTRRVAARGRQRLIEAFGSLDRALAAPEDRLASISRIGPETARALKTATDAAVDDEVRRAAAMGARIVGVGGEGYPERLAQIDDAPLVLYVRGDLPPDEIAVAIVGARNATPHGVHAARVLSKGLAEAGVTVISGLARGIDAAAHQACLEASGRTIAVLGSGLDRSYPPEHDGLAESIIARGGAVVSEMPLGTPPLAFHFPRRNRIVAGLSRGVVVVEAAEKSGSLITARHALDQGREVMAVPARIGDTGSAGSLALIREGAALITSATDILNEIDVPVPAPAAKPAATATDAATAPPDLTPVERQIYGALFSDRTVHVDHVIDETGLEASKVFAGLMQLEMRRVVKKWAGKLYQRW